MMTIQKLKIEQWKNDNPFSVSQTAKQLVLRFISLF